MTGEEIGKQPAFAGYLGRVQFQQQGMSTRTAIAKDICAAIAGGYRSNPEGIMALGSVAEDLHISQAEFLATMAITQTDALLDALAKEAP